MIQNLTFKIPAKMRLIESQQVMRCSGEFYALVLNIQKETGLSQPKITEAIAKYLCDKIAIEEVEGLRQVIAE